MNLAKADCEELLNAVLPFAEKMLRKNGEFYPYGAAMRPDGEIVLVAGYDGDDHPSSQKIIDLLKEGFRQSAQKKKYKATAVVFDVLTTMSSGNKTDAIEVSLNHRDDYSVVILLPYKLTGSKITTGEIESQKGDADIFLAF